MAVAADMVAESRNKVMKRGGRIVRLFYFKRNERVNPE